MHIEKFLFIDNPDVSDDGIQLRENFGDGHFGGLFDLIREFHRNRLLRIDGDGVEDYVGSAALDIEDIQ